MNTKHFLILAGISALLSLSVSADIDGQHNDKTCYGTTAGGIDISSPCSSRGTTCNADFSCSIGTVAGEVGDTITEQSLESVELTPANDPSTASDAKAKAKSITKNKHKGMDKKATKLREKGSGMATGKRTAAEGGGDDNDIRVKVVGKKTAMPKPSDGTEGKACPADLPETCPDGDKACVETKATCHRGHVTVLK